MNARLIVAIGAAVALFNVSGCKNKGGTTDKPIIYFYPEEVTEVTVKFADSDSVQTTHTYPEYGEDGWHVIAHPDGTLYDVDTEDEYYALYWEGHTEQPDRLKAGSVVAAEDTVDFFEDSLEQLGLTPREANEFIIYWAPILEQSPHNFIHFSTDDWDDQVPLDIVPAPDSLVRVMMYYRQVKPSLQVSPQTFTTPKRVGFTVVEWGGTELAK